MRFNDLFRKKSVPAILKQLELDQQNADLHGLSKHLGVRDLTALGIAAIVGAGIFSTIGSASFNGGPAVIFLFLFTAIACSFAAFAYAEFASMVPVSGSAYTYSYVAFGELIAWIIGWALIMEYAIGNITVAISWSDYFTGLLSSMDVHLPQWMTMDFFTASKGYAQATALMLSGKTFRDIDAPTQEAFLAWTKAPSLGPLHFVADLPALLIIILITWLVYRGIKESRNAGNLMVVIKLCVVLLVIAVGIFHVDSSNWSPFAPNGIGGILKGVSSVFFAYIGFDAISTTAEECKNPQRDLPRGMMWAIIICTVLYIIIALVLTGMVKYNTLAVGDPLAFVFDSIHMKWMSGIIAVSAIVAMASVLLVFQLGQPRIWMSMSRDGLLPKSFSKIHPRFKTPSFATIVTGFVVAVPALFMNLTMVTDLCSIGTLFAFVLVCAGVLKLELTAGTRVRIQSATHPEKAFSSMENTAPPTAKFKTPYINSRYIMPLLLFITLILSITLNKDGVTRFVTNEKQINAPTTLVTSLSANEIENTKLSISNSDKENFATQKNDLDAYLTSLDPVKYESVVQSLSVDESKKYQSGMELFVHKIPLWIFIVIALYVTWLCFKHRMSLIPVLGLLCCLYMMSELGVSNWIGFSIWLLIGLVIYFTYGIRNSKLIGKTS